MKTITMLSSLALLASSSLAQQFGFTSDPYYDADSGTPAGKLACSVESLNIPFAPEGTPSIGEISTVIDSHRLAIAAALPPSQFNGGAGCGTCWTLTNTETNSVVISVFVIDKAQSETFVTQVIPGDKTPSTISAQQVDRSKCGF